MGGPWGVASNTGSKLRWSLTDSKMEKSPEDKVLLKEEQFYDELVFCVHRLLSKLTKNLN